MHFGVGRAGLVMEAFAHETAGGIEHHATHQGIGTGSAAPQGGQLQRPLHPGPPAAVHAPMRLL